MPYGIVGLFWCMGGTCCFHLHFEWFWFTWFQAIIGATLTVKFRMCPKLTWKNLV